MGCYWRDHAGTILMDWLPTMVPPIRQHRFLNKLLDSLHIKVGTRSSLAKLRPENLGTHIICLTDKS